MRHDRLLYGLVVSALVLAHQLPNLLVLVIIDLILQVLRSVQIALDLLEKFKLVLGSMLIFRAESLFLLQKLFL